jgi:energy-coupling factor transporter ATP-binding protein EcfA2
MSDSESENVVMSNRKRKKPHLDGSNGANATRPTTGSYFLSLELENVRCFSAKQSLDLSDGKSRPVRWTILLGENGTGKTTILQLLAAFERVQEPIPGVSFTKHGQSGLRYYCPAPEGLRRDPSGSSSQFSISAHHGSPLALNDNKGISYECTGSIDSKNIMTTTILVHDPPKCYAYGASRPLGVSSLNPEMPKSMTENLSFDVTKLLNAEEWLLRLDYSASKASKIQDQQKKRLEIAKGVLIDALPDISEIRFTAPTNEKPTPGVEFKTPYGWVPLRQLGYGYRTMIAWVIDFTSRMVERYPNCPDPLAEPAVVLVDEIDLHLHPKWQRKLIEFLTEQFSNTQFIVTAHSPLIVQAASDANLVLLRRNGDHVVIENNPGTIRGWRVDQILTSELFGLETARPPAMEKLLMRRKELLTKPRLSKANEKELEELTAKLGQIPTGESFEQARTMDLIEKSLELLKQGTNS